jgi:4-hydroxybenzoate polyprenyltransferase
VIAGLFRLHLVAVAALSAAVFGWLFAGQFLLWASAIAALDWLLASLWNRASDVREDLLNEVEGAQLLARSGRELSRLALGVLSLSFFAALRLGWPLLAMRLAFHAGGLVYSYPVFRRRVKEILLVKNLFAGLLWVLTSIGYPLALGRRVPLAGEVLALSLFLLPLAVSYTLLYDLRDVAGDAAAGIVTVPLALGVPRTRVFMELLLALSAAALLGGYLLGALRLVELAMLAAPLQQALVLRFWIPREPSRHAVEGITWLSAAQLLSYLAWASANFPLPRL